MPSQPTSPVGAAVDPPVGSGVVPGGDPGFERLPLWRNGWRLAVVWLFGLILFLIYTVPLMLAAEGVEPVGSPAVAAVLLVLDLLVGHLVLVLVAFRRRAPVTIAAVATALSAVSLFGAPASLLAVLSLATRRRLVPLVWIGLVSIATGLVHELFIVPHTVPPEFQSAIGQGWIEALAYTLFAVLMYGIVVLIGWNMGSRRELAASWRRQAETANREQSARVAQAQLAERARIAREMHDVLAHRLSLVAMHAGVLAHRPDLSEQERAEAAEVVRAGAHQALEELREVLGVLRTDGEGDGNDGDRLPAVEAPQPGLSAIPALVAEVTSSGHEVRLLADERLWPLSVSLPTTVGRHAYRVVQEALTNARKHGGGSAVTVEIAGAPGEGLTIEVRNPLPRGAAGTLPGGGRGLTGMAERVQLAGGRFEAGVEVADFAVRVWLPWARAGADQSAGRAGES